MLPRVAFFPDSFHEVNGVAQTSRNFEAFARRRGMPFLCVRAGIRREYALGCSWDAVFERMVAAYPH